MLDLPLLFGPMNTVKGAAVIAVSVWALKLRTEIRVSMPRLYITVRPILAVYFA